MFSAQGQENLQAALKGVKAQLDSIENGVKLVGPMMTQAFGAARERVESFVRSGIQSSTWGTVFQFQLDRLSRTVAGLFTPEIRKAVEGLNQFTNWLQRLSPHTKEFAASLLKGGVAMLAVATVMPKVTGAIFAAVPAVVSLTGAILGLEGSTGFGALLPVLGFVVTGLSALAAGAFVGTGGLGKLWNMVKPLAAGLSELWQSVTTALGPVVATIGDELTGALAVAADLFARMLPGVTAAVEAFGEGARHFDGVEDLIAAAQREIVANTAALVKGSRFMRMERVVQALAAEPPKGAH